MFCKALQNMLSVKIEINRYRDKKVKRVKNKNVKMIKLPITDKFLWDLYCFIEKADDVVDFMFSNKYRQASILRGDENPVFKQYRRKMGRIGFNTLIYRLKKNNFIKSKNLQGKSGVIITKEGFDKILKTSFKAKERNKRKDGKWIMITFDIPEKHKKARALLRSILKNLGFKIFQQSVWITPYDVSEKTERLLQSYSLDRYVRIFLIEEMEEAGETE